MGIHTRAVACFYCRVGYSDYNRRLRGWSGELGVVVSDLLFTQPSSSGCASVCGATAYIMVPAPESGKHSLVFLLLCLGRPAFAGFYCGFCASDSKRDGVAVPVQLSVGFVALERRLRV